MNNEMTTTSASVTNNLLLTAALNYASQGLPVFPCSLNKSPLTSNGFKDASIDSTQITEWWTKYPDAMIGMPTGRTTNRVVIDLDVKNDKDGLTQWRDLQTTHNAPPIKTLVIRTASGGEHWHFTWPGNPVKSTADKIAPGVDTRADGGYVIMPPSSSGDMGTYAVVSDVPVAQMPPWLTVVLQAKGIIPSTDRKDPPQAPVTYANTTDTELRIARALELIDPNESYDTWLTVGMALHAWDEIKGLNYWEIWSRKGISYTEGEPEKKWASFQKDGEDGEEGITLGTLFHISKKRELATMPEPTPLPSPATVEPFDFDMLPASLIPWVKDIAERMQCAPDVVAVPAIISMATLVGRKIAIRPKRFDDWSEVPTLWGAVIGRPGTLKTPAISEAMALLRRIEHTEDDRFQRANENYELQKASWQNQTEAAMPEIKAALKSGDATKAEELKKLLPSEPQEPGRTRFIVNDTTVEALGQILQSNPNGVLMFRDELTGWLRSLEKDNQRDARAFYLEAWNGKNRFVTDRISRGSIEIECAIVSIMGGIQPGPLQAYMHDIDGRGDDGLLQRFQMLVWPEIKTEWKDVDRYPDKIAREKAFKTYELLYGLTPQTVMAQIEENEIPYLRFTEEAQSIFNTWRGTLEEKLASGILTDAMQAHLAKYRKLVPVLALLFHLADGGKAGVGAIALKKAIQWARYLESHAEKVYGSRKTSGAVLATSLLAKITSGALSDGFTVRDIYRHQWTGLLDPNQVQAAVDMLVSHGYLAEQLRKEGGRPCKAYRINPRLAKSTTKIILTKLTEAVPIKTDEVSTNQTCVSSVSSTASQLQINDEACSLTRPSVSSVSVLHYNEEQRKASQASTSESEVFQEAIPPEDGNATETTKDATDTVEVNACA